MKYRAIVDFCDEGVEVKAGGIVECDDVPADLIEAKHLEPVEAEAPATPAEPEQEVAVEAKTVEAPAMQAEPVEAAKEPEKVPETKKIKPRARLVEAPAIVETKRMKTMKFGEILSTLMQGKAIDLPMTREEAGIETKAILGQGNTTPADGGYLSVNDFLADIGKAAVENSVVARKCNQVNVTGPGLTIPMINETTRAATSNIYGGVAVYRVGEGAAITESKLAFAQRALTLKKLAALVYVTEEMLADVSAAESLIRDRFVAALAYAIDDEILRGTLGAVEYPLLDSASCYDVALGSTPTFAQLATMYAGLLPDAKAEWFISRAGWSKLIALTDTGSNNIFVPYAPDAPQGRLLGLPVNIVGQLVAPNAHGCMYLADMSKFVLATKTASVQESVSSHVQFLTDQVAFKFTYRLNGSPFIPSAITMADGTKASYFVQGED